MMRYQAIPPATHLCSQGCCRTLRRPHRNGKFLTTNDPRPVYRIKRLPVCALGEQFLGVTNQWCNFLGFWVSLNISFIIRFRNQNIGEN